MLGHGPLSLAGEVEAALPRMKIFNGYSNRLTEGANFRCSNPCPSALLQEAIGSSVECKNEHNFKLVESMNGT